MTQRNYPWDVLNIDKTDDSKTVKKAYAVLVKLYKPDEHPQKFKEIQSAYKEALSIVKSQSQDLNFTAPKTNHNWQNFESKESPNDTKRFKFGNHEEPHIDEDEAQEHHKNEQDQLIAELFKHLQSTAFAPLAIKNKLTNWAFIENFHKIDDLTLKSQTAQEVFNKVAEYNLFQMQQNGTLLIGPPILKYFNDIFDWNSQWSDYQHHFHEHYFKVTLDAINDSKSEKNISEKQWLSKRFIAFIIDGFIAMLLTFVGTELFMKDSQNQPAIAVVFFVVYMLLTEILTKSHTSPGKRLKKILILDIFGNYCLTKTIILRQLIFHLCMIPAYLLFIDPSKNTISLLMASTAVLIINFITVLIKKNLLHDHLTNTIVTHMPNTY